MNEQELKYRERLKIILNNSNELIYNYITVGNTFGSLKTQLDYANELIAYSKYQDFNKLSSVTEQCVKRYIYYKGSNSTKGSLSDLYKNKILTIIKDFFRYLKEEVGIIQKNPLAEAKRWRVSKHKNIAFLDEALVQKMKDNVVSNQCKTSKQMKYREKFHHRDVAIIFLLLGTGIRNSELSNIDLEDVDLDQKTIRIKRKGGGVTQIGINNSIREYLHTYLKIRQKIDVSTKALFLNNNNQRLGYKGINAIVKLYNPTNSNISTHITRKSFATNLYNETGDIGLVSVAIGHSDISTTKSTYVASEHDRVNSYLKQRE